MPKCMSLMIAGRADLEKEMTQVGRAAMCGHPCICSSHPLDAVKFRLRWGRQMLETCVPTYEQHRHDTTTSVKSFIWRLDKQ